MRPALSVWLAGAGLALGLLAPAPAAAEGSLFIGFGHHFGHRGYYGHPYGYHPYRYPYRSHFGYRTYYPYAYDAPRTRPGPPAGEPPPAPRAAAEPAPAPAARAETPFDASHCREFTKTVRIGGEEVEAHGTACRQPDGSWRIAN